MLVLALHLLCFVFLLLSDEGAIASPSSPAPGPPALERAPSGMFLSAWELCIAILSEVDRLCAALALTAGVHVGSFASGYLHHVHSHYYVHTLDNEPVRSNIHLVMAPGLGLQFEFVDECIRIVGTK